MTRAAMGSSRLVNITLHVEIASSFRSSDTKYRTRPQSDFKQNVSDMGCA